MGFQIRFEDSPVNIGDLDKEAAAFWNKEVDDKHYADPTPLFVNSAELQGAELRSAMLRHELNTWGNWFDMIGWNIHHPQTNYTSGWDNVKCSLWAVQAYSLYKYLFNSPDPTCTPEQMMNEHIEASKQYLKPYFDLIDHWAAKGYVPHQVKD